MTPDDLRAAVKPFTKLSEAYMNSGESVDLGLSIANALCKLHGGSLVLESENGAGLTARATLPAR